MPEMTNIEMYLEDSIVAGAAGHKPTLALNVANGYVPQNLNLGFPEVREVSSKRPSANGTFDYTSLFGAKAVSASIGMASELVPGATDQVLEDRLRLWVMPSVRAYLYYRFAAADDWRRVFIRGAAASLGLNFVKNGFRIITLGWKAPDGVNESATETVETVNPGSSIEDGRDYDLVFDRTYPASAVIGAKPISNLGNAPVYPRVRIYGPCTQPRIENQTTGKALEFDASFSLLAGEFLEIDFQVGTVLLNGNPLNSRYQFVDFAASEWWDLIPGINLIRFYPGSSSAPSVAELRFRSAFI